MRHSLLILVQPDWDSYAHAQALGTYDAEVEQPRRPQSTNFLVSVVVMVPSGFATVRMVVMEVHLTR